MALIESNINTMKDKNHERMMKRMSNIDAHAYLFYIPKALHKKVKRKLVEEERTLKGLLIDYLNAYIDE